MKIRLHQFLSKTGAFPSKRDAKDAVWAGDITVNGKVMKDIRFQFNPRTKPVAYQGEVLTMPEDHITLAVHKPAGYVCSRLNKQERSLGKISVFDLVPEHVAQRDKDRMLTVGRLDEATTGLLLLTTDGQLVHQVADPDQHVAKVYLVHTASAITDEDIKRLGEGIAIELEDNGERSMYQTQPATVQRLDEHGVQMTLHEGKKRQVRRMLASLDHKVLDLHRAAVGDLWLEDMGLDEGDSMDMSDLNVLSLLGEVA